jgi:hypothetical protein
MLCKLKPNHEKQNGAPAVGDLLAAAYAAVSFYYLLMFNMSKYDIAYTHTHTHTHQNIDRNRQRPTEKKIERKEEKRKRKSVSACRDDLIQTYPTRINRDNDRDRSRSGDREIE